MFKVVIIDDETLVRIGIKSMIDWEKHNCEIVGEASNGQSGYELIINTRPDIVITDIKMPVTDGLEMIQRLSLEKIKTRVIILSSYNDFDLARKVMKVGVEDYIVKLELEPEILIDTLTRIKEILMLDYKQHYENSRAEKYLKSSQYNLREEFFKKVIAKIIKDENQIREELEYLQLTLNEENIMCIGIQIHNDGKFNNYEEADISLLEFSILNIVDEIVKDFFIGYCIKWSIKEYIVIVTYDDLISAAAVRKKIEDMSLRITTMLKQYFNTEVVIAVSNSNKKLSGISTACMQSLKALKHSFYSDMDKIIFFNEIYETQEVKEEMDLKEIEKMLKYIASNDIEAIEITFEKIVNSIIKGKQAKEKYYDVCAKLAYVIEQAVGEDEKSLEIIFGDNKGVFEKVMKLESIKEIVLWIKKIEEGINIYLVDKNSVQNNKIISKAKKYVKENIAATINLQDIASSLNISSGYFCTIFKQHTDINFIDYVTKAKIEEAKRLLRESDYKIFEIAHMIGYDNAYYFSKVFKKVTGLTPRDFIMRIGN